MEPNNLVRNIHIGELIGKVMKEKNIPLKVAVYKMKLSTKTVNKQLSSSSIEAIDLLKWSKILRYDFFRLYSCHLMLHHGISNALVKNQGAVKIEGIHIRKNVYTKELIYFLISKVRKQEMSAMQVVKKYGIPKTTFYKWLQKYNIEDE
jgi:hypothetical protein